MSPPGCPKGEYRSAEREGTPLSPPDRPKGEYRSAKREATPLDSPMDGSRTSLAPQTYTRVCALADIPRLGARVLERASGCGGNVAVFRTADDRVFALADRCPHKGGPLSQGIVHGDRVACPLHNWNINLGTGTAVEPDEGCVERYPVRLADGWVHVALLPR